MGQISWTFEAERWLKDMFEYITRDNPQAAANVVSGIYKKAQILSDQPRVGYRYEHKSEEEIRILLYGHYRVTYQILDSEDVVVLGVFHGALEIENYLIL